MKTVPWSALITTVGLVAIAALAIVAVRLAVGGEPARVDLNPTELSKLAATADSRAFTQIQDFVNSDQDPCLLPSGELVRGTGTLYPDLASFVNDVRLIVTGSVTRVSLEPPATGGVASNVMIDFDVTEVLLGDDPGAALSVDSNARVMTGRSGLVRLALGLDPCEHNELVLFLDIPSEDSGFRVVGWLSGVDADPVEPSALPLAVPVDETYGNVGEMVMAVRGVVERQLSTELPRGRLLCEFMYQSERYRDPVACPGDKVNLYDALGRSVPPDEAFLVVPGKSGAEPVRKRIDPHSSVLSAVFSALRFEAPVQSSDPEWTDGILINLTYAASDMQATERSSFTYSPSRNALAIRNGRVDAPEGFGDLIEQLVDEADEE
jgi:hypothetical protein